MARKNGNPDLQQYQYRQIGEEPLEASVKVRVSHRQKAKVARIPGFADKLRQWIDQMEG